MRFKLVLLVQPQIFGSTLPVSYQYELSSCIHKKMMANFDLYQNWLNLNGFVSDNYLRHRLFSLSNFYIPKIKVEIDRLNILAKRIQLWISLLPERGTAEYVQSIFAEQDLCIGDKKSQVLFTVESITEIPEPCFEKQMQYLSLSPIVFSSTRSNNSIEYIGPDDPGYQQALFQSLLEKYRFFYGKELSPNTEFQFEINTPPKRKGIFIKRFTPEESKVIGYMYKFTLTTDPAIHKLLYNTGFGEKINLGFGCTEVLK